MFSRRGTYLIEAAVVLPIVILSIITVILIVMYCYECSAERSMMHKDLYGSGRKSASVEVSLVHSGMLNSSGSQTFICSHHVSDGVRYVLRKQKAKELVTDD